MREIKQWQSFLSTEGKSKATINNYVADVQMLLDWIKEQRQVLEVDIEIFKSITLFDLHSFMSYLMNERGNSESTRARRVNAIKNFYNYLCDVNAEVENVAKKLKIPKLPQRETVYLTEEECQKLINVIGGCHRERDKAIVLLFLNTGIRLEELININVNDIKEEEINVDGETRVIGSVKVIGKGNKERVVYFNGNTMEAIKVWLNIRPNVNTPALFVSERKNRLTVSPIQWMIKDNLIRIGRKDCSVHKLRHSAATMMLKNGTDIRTVQEILGHANLNTTARYTHIGKQEKKQAAELITLI